MNAEIVNKDFDGDYEFRIFSNLPEHLKSKIVSFDDEKVSLSDINPSSLVCIQISANPGVKPFLIQDGKTTFDLFKLFAKQRGFSISDFNEALQKKCSIPN